MKEQKPLLQLVKRKDTFKLVIPDEVESKIRFLCKNIWDVEWSGVLFYKVEGSFEDKSLIITCVDVFQMDEGNATYTEYNMSPDVVTYMCDHPELLEEGVYQGLIHSHNRMSTFFSSTDTGTLREEGSDTNHFVSLIVNNEGKYTAAVTRKISSVQVIHEDFSYNTWGGSKIEGKDIFEDTEEYIEYFYLEIEKNSSNFETEMFERIKEIRDSKKRYQPQLSNKSNQVYNKGTYVPVGTYGKPVPSNKPIKVEDYSIKTQVGKMNTIPAYKQTELPFEDTESYPYGVVTADKKVVDSMVRQIVTSSIIIPNESNIDVRKWALNMNKVYSKRFKTLKSFEIFASNYIDYLIDETDPLIDPNITSDVTELAALLAFDVREELTKLPESEWLNVYIKMLDDYIL